MAFGAWKGGVSGQQGTYGLSGMFEGLSTGLATLGKEFMSQETEDRKDKRATAQEAAQQAFQMNLARFNKQAAADQSEAAEKHQDARADKHDTTEAAHWTATQSHQERQDAQQARFQSAELGIRAQSESNSERRLNQSDARQDTSDRRAGETERKNSVNEQLRSIHENNTSYSGEIKDLEKEMKDQQIDPTSDAAGGYTQKIAALRRQIDSGNAESKKLRSGLQGADQKSQDFIPEKVSPQSSTPGTPPLPADRQALVQQYIKAGAQPEDALKTVTTLPQDAVDKAMKVKPPQASTDGAPGQPSNAAIDDFIDTGQAPQGSSVPGAPPAAATASAPAPPSATAPPPPDAGDPNATPAAAPAAPDPTEQYAQMSQQLQQSPEGQGALTTLDRLASAPEGPIADKMRRAAENSLSQQFPDQDTGGFVDYYLQQQQQEPEPAPDTEMA